MPRRGLPPLPPIAVRILRYAVPGAIAVAVALAAIPLTVTSGASFFSRYPDLARSYKTLQDSKHRGLACGECHIGTGSKTGFRLASAADFYRGLVGRADEPSYVKMATPTRKACIKCHENDWSDEASRTMQVPHPAHLRVATEKRDCVGCHKWTAHEEAYMERHKTMPFSGVCISFGCHVGTKTADECRFCHHAVEADQAEWRTSHPKVVHERGANTCLEVCHDSEQCRLCHTQGKRPNVKGPQIEAGFRALQTAHAKGDWLEKHGTEALASESKCLYCHVSTAECESCHSERPAFHGSKDTWLASHKKVAKDERRCLACHKKKWCEDCHVQFKETR